MLQRATRSSPAKTPNRVKHITNEVRNAMSKQETDLTSRGVDAARDYTEEISSALTNPAENRVKQWFLLKGRRPVVTAVLLLAIFVLLVGLAVIRPLNMRDLLTKTNTVQTLFSALLSGAILLVSIVVSINSIVLSQEITDIESQQERISASMDFRRHIEEFIETDVIPARPAEFLRVVLHTLLHQAQSLADIAADSTNDEFREQVETFRDKVSEDVDQARTTLGDARFGTFKVLLVGLNYDYSGQLYAARTFKHKYADTLTDEEQEAIDDLTETLTFFATGREYFKSLYYKRELAELSSRLLYVSLPVIVFTSYVLLALDANLIPEMTILGVPPLLLFVTLAYVIALAPYVVLTAYVIRAATIALRTLAAGPFILHKGSTIDSLNFERAEDSMDWEETQNTTND